MAAKRFNWIVLQEGTLALRPSGQVNDSLEHRPTSTLIWPVDEPPTRDNTILVDPYFTANSFRAAEAVLSHMRLSFADIGRVFVTHKHFDHLPHYPSDAQSAPTKRFEPKTDETFAGLKAIPCPGHAEDLRALVFTSPTLEQVWVVADAILDEEWLRAWKYFWPNGYSRAEILDTWRSVAMILAAADVILPGHGAAIRVTDTLLADLIAAFPNAELAADCPDVEKTLRGRLKILQESSRNS
jgi:glyoxylase-like metal-dependent hydrolase (beta-lactamase superfamily II)